MDETVLADLERELAWPVRRKAHEDRSQDERVELMVANSMLLQAVPDLVAELRRLRGLVVEYGRHAEGCNAQWGDRYRCRCGWRDVEQGFIAPAVGEDTDGHGG
jgi:hypothetical protein